MRNILICGYRDWAFDLYQKVNEREIDNCIYVDDKDLLERMIDYYQPIYLFFRHFQAPEKFRLSFMKFIQTITQAHNASITQAHI